MTIYLYVKSHNKTGLKYLGKTINNPYTYTGSGKDWILHIKEHGNDVTTTILQVCSSKEELTYWGRYFSKIFKVTTAVDNYGNRIWANIIHETGGGDGSNWADIEKAKITAKKISETIKKNKVGKAYNQTGKDNHMYGKTGELHHNYGKKYSKESCELISLNHHDVSKENNPRARLIRITTPDGVEYEACGDLTGLCEAVGMSVSTAYKNLSKGTEYYTTGKFKGFKIEYLD
jgi:hypothetical protein